MKLRFIVPIVVFAGLVLLFTYGLGRNPAALPSPYVGKPAPEFTLPDLDGRVWSLRDFRGRKVFLLAWASW